ncbi:uncharacterized protein BDZ83DRAFT_364307 [Colletotrichum acutatum]|uniref:Uncharacterized protein n=1 Tax=Glomerella acutata TaxID=27357 RepID=A0AAD8ULJ2_GLOAC|nr:uncharacterized protein BDZ83DRAFT_364307 [Colletotrichum acutatum]KAK1723979.1 hypothetical protein BDZ83DRAFT_364307 [Colletotrichum acutatum]
MMPRSPFISNEETRGRSFRPMERAVIRQWAPISRHRARGAFSGDGIDCRGDRRAVGGLWHRTQLPASTTRVWDKTRGAWLVPLSFLTLYRLCPRDFWASELCILTAMRCCTQRERTSGSGPALRYPWIRYFGFGRTMCVNVLVMAAYVRRPTTWQLAQRRFDLNDVYSTLIHSQLVLGVIFHSVFPLVIRILVLVKRKEGNIAVSER